MNAESAPKGAPQIVAPQRDRRQFTHAGEINHFEVGDRVVTLPTVRPRQYGSRTGTVVEMRGGEIGVRFGSERSHDAATWFRPRELTSTLGQTRHKAAGRVASEAVL